MRLTICVFSRVVNKIPLKKLLNANQFFNSIARIQQINQSNVAEKFRHFSLLRSPHIYKKSFDQFSFDFRDSVRFTFSPAGSHQYVSLAFFSTQKIYKEFSRINCAVEKWSKEGLKTIGENSVFLGRDGALTRITSSQIAVIFTIFK